MFPGVVKLCQHIEPNDMPSTVYIKRCAELARQTLPEPWDGVYVMTTK